MDTKFQFITLHFLSFCLSSEFSVGILDRISEHLRNYETFRPLSQTSIRKKLISGPNEDLSNICSGESEVNSRLEEFKSLITRKKDFELYRHYNLRRKVEPVRFWSCINWKLIERFNHHDGSSKFNRAKYLKDLYTVKMSLEYNMQLFKEVLFEKTGNWLYAFPHVFTPIHKICSVPSSLMDLYLFPSSTYLKTHIDRDIELKLFLRKDNLLSSKESIERMKDINSHFLDWKGNLISSHQRFTFSLYHHVDDDYNFTIAKNNEAIQFPPSDVQMSQMESFLCKSLLDLSHSNVSSDENIYFTGKATQYILG